MIHYLKASGVKGRMNSCGRKSNKVTLEAIDALFGTIIDLICQQHKDAKVLKKEHIEALVVNVATKQGTAA